MSHLTERLVITDSLAGVPAEDWDALAVDQPALQHAWLYGMEATQCATHKTGWQAQHILLYRDDVLCGAMPLYLKSHSRGEYVFDYAWSHAWHHHGIPYYPKALSAVPFTPVPGPRLLARNQEDRQALLQAAIRLTNDNGLSSLHILFPDDTDRKILQDNGMLLRQNVQFHWTNRGYHSMNDFFADLNQKNRKKMHQGRRKLAAEGVQFQWHEGGDIDDATLEFFYRCYRQTYLEHGNLPYLSLEFFAGVRHHLPECMVIVTANRNGTPVAAALNLRSSNTLYGRYWGALEFISGLHFEACYMQGIEYCIARGLTTFEGGAQGEHKLARGLLPVKTWSAHWIPDPRFRSAIAAWLDQEHAAVDAYIDELRQHSPYRKTP